ncbi:murein L,D-transpeptidase YcbB/YkuD [Sphingomonas zeicaulis]|uniref:L,D-transpeptidase family protein n=1 Tax=Sphingomonas zeicaulis TaxID=1632740 RepID=UPI003D1CCCF8
MRLGRIPLCFIAALAALSLNVTLPASATAAAPAAKPRAARPAPPVDTTALRQAIRDAAGGTEKSFYAARGYQPLWAANGRIGRSAETLLTYLETAELDGLRPSSYGVEKLRAAVVTARSGDPHAVAEAEVRLSAAFARYARDQRGKARVKMDYADRRLKPRRPKPEAVLRAAAFPKSFDAYITDMAWMSEHYVRLRTLTGRARKTGASADALERLRLNLERARLLPGPFAQHIVVDASSGRLWYYEGGVQVGTMRVVVGAKETQTPMLAGTLQWAILNPYWNVPDYLAQRSIAKKVLAGRSLAMMRMEALSDWSANPVRLDPRTIDWNTVAAGTREVRIRQLPGPQNSMGKVKFLFPNDEGIYLHDTPDRDLLKKEDRHFSNGCIRLENAAALGRWLMQKPLKYPKQPEQAVALPVGVPVYLTYITAVPTERGLGFRADVYGRDG